MILCALLVRVMFQKEQLSDSKINLPILKRDHANLLTCLYFFNLFFTFSCRETYFESTLTELAASHIALVGAVIDPIVGFRASQMTDTAVTLISLTAVTSMYI